MVAYPKSNLLFLSFEGEANEAYSVHYIASSDPTSIRHQMPPPSYNEVQMPPPSYNEVSCMGVYYHPPTPSESIKKIY